MSFNFNGVKANLEGIDQYLEANGIKLSNAEKQKLGSIFTEADRPKGTNNKDALGNGELDIIEQREFQNAIENEKEGTLAKIMSFIKDFFNGVNKKKYDSPQVEESVSTNVKKPEIINSTKPKSLAKFSSASREEVFNIALDQYIKRMPALKKIKSAKERIKIARQKYPQIVEKASRQASYVTEIVISNCSKYDVEDLSPLIIDMLGNETGGYVFTDKVLKNPKSQFKGVMQTGPAALKGLYADKTSSDAKHIKELKKKYPTTDKLYKAIQTDVELGLQVGILVFKMILRSKQGNVKNSLKQYCGNQYCYNYAPKIPTTLKT